MENKKFSIKAYIVEYQHPENYSFYSCFKRADIYARSKEDAIKIVNDQLSYNGDHLKKDFKKKATLIDRRILHCFFDENDAFFYNDYDNNKMFTQKDEMMNMEYLIDKYLD
mgnify:CR=1 FL=1|tara:strand:+ start:270 stop:602 length:333 start_codon:yes stop_codon:yes gene_type:complete